MTSGITHPCPFCATPRPTIWETADCFAIPDAYPVTPGHTLVIPRRHVATWFDASADEQRGLMEGVAAVRAALDAELQPDGYNVGFNVGAAAGQTVFHLHVHVIPRYKDDVPDPRGGVRHLIPGKGNYLSDEWAGVPHDGVLVRGDDDALLPHLRAHIDSAHEVDIAVAFILQSGVDAIEENLRDLLARGGRLRILTGDYLDVTDPDALARLLDLAACVHEEGRADEGAAPANSKEPRVALRVFDGRAQSFHPKAYIFRGSDGRGVACVGSSNLSATALRRGVEWNMRLVSSRDARGFADITRAFERLFVHPNTQPLGSQWLAAYRARRRLEKFVATEMTALQKTVEVEPPRPPVVPNEIQAEALAALSQSRAEGHRAGLVVLATGLGKTWLAAFDATAFLQERAAAASADTNNPADVPAGSPPAPGIPTVPHLGRVLFVAHRDEILQQAMQTFRRIRPEATLGLYTRAEKALDVDVLFASVQALSRKDGLARFSRDAFAYIVVDEFHHAAASTYRRLIEWFDPAFLLGLTATPERTDGGDLLGLCGENLVFRCDLAEGIRRGLLSPFAYFGVPDEVEYANIPWRNRRFDHDALEAAVATEARARNALEQYREHGGERGIAFCVGVRHANYMADFFNRSGVRAVAVHAGEGSAPRATSLARLAAGEIDLVCAVDMLNEGVDVPELDTVLMLRPTDSRVMWLQQIGRGLRRREGKVLKIIDYIGNHRSFLMKPQVLLSALCDLRRPWSHAELRVAIEQASLGELDLPPGCSVTYDLESLDVLRALLPHEASGEQLRAYYDDFRAVQGTRPTAAEAMRDGYNPRTAREQYTSWVDFVRQMGDLDAGLVDRHRDWFIELERTPMIKSYKMIVLQAMLALDCFPGEVSLDTLADMFARLARRSPRLAADVECDLADASAVRAHLRKNPIHAWTGGFTGKGSRWFAFSDGVFRFLPEVDARDREAFVAVVSELVAWRLADYLRRNAAGEGVALLKVSHASGNPLLFLDRKKHPWLPSGWTTVWVDDVGYELNFVKVAVNVARRVGETGNALHPLLRSMLGERAGQPGTASFVRLQRDGDGYRLSAGGEG